MFQDKTLTCKDCGAEFTFTAGEQEFYAERGLQNEPQRCKPCRNAKRGGSSSNTTQREMFTAKCASCGRDAKVPFKPSNDRPVYCSDCFSKQR